MSRGRLKIHLTFSRCCILSISVILQAAFHPMETVVDVIAHIRESLDPSFAESASFYLYVSPPLQKLAPEKTLSQLGLVPAAHTYLSWIDAPQPPDAAHAEVRGWYLRQELVRSFSLSVPHRTPLDAWFTLLSL
jgi:hypothetical protein